MSSTPPDVLVPQDMQPAAAPGAAAPAAMSATACARELRARFPGLFGSVVRPVKLHVQTDIQARAPDVFTRKALSAFLRRHTGSTAYLLALSRGKQRFDLDGQPCGEISEEHRAVAAAELARRRENVAAREAAAEDERRQRANLLRDYERTTLTPANFCALTGITLPELEARLAQARDEAAQARQAQRTDERAHREPHDPRRPPRGRLAEPSRRPDPSPGKAR